MDSNQVEIVYFSFIVIDQKTGSKAGARTTKSNVIVSLSTTYRMLSPTTINAAVGGSLVVTLSTFGYLVSSGIELSRARGDKGSQVYQERMERAERVSSGDLKTIEQQQKNVKRSVAVKDREAPLALRETPRKIETISKVERVSSDTQSEDADYQSRSPWRNCHTCSGPRIWFYADRFRRLRRRIGPPAKSEDDGANSS